MNSNRKNVFRSIALGVLVAEAMTVNRRNNAVAKAQEHGQGVPLTVISSNHSKQIVIYRQLASYMYNVL
jgi:hypothetical protein